MTGETMLLRVVMEENDTEIIVVTLQQDIQDQEVLAERIGMRAEYDPQTDILTITLREVRIRESDEVRPGVIADFGYDGGIVRFEVMDASKKVDHAREMQFKLAGQDRPA